MLHVTHLLHMFYWIKIWTLAYHGIEPMNPKILMNLPCRHLYIQDIWQMVRYRCPQHHFRDRWRFQIWFSGYHFCLFPFCNILGIGLHCNIPRMTRCLSRREKMLPRYLQPRYQVDSNRSLYWHERRDTVCHLWIQSLSRKICEISEKILVTHKLRGEKVREVLWDRSKSHQRIFVTWWNMHLLLRLL